MKNFILNRMYSQYKIEDLSLVLSIEPRIEMIQTNNSFIDNAAERRKTNENTHDDFVNVFNFSLHKRKIDFSSRSRSRSKKHELNSPNSRLV